MQAIPTAAARPLSLQLAAMAVHNDHVPSADDDETTEALNIKYYIVLVNCVVVGGCCEGAKLKLNFQQKPWRTSRRSPIPTVPPSLFRPCSVHPGLPPQSGS